MSGAQSDFDSAINDRYVYSKKSILYESNHIQVYAGIDAQTQQEITLRFVDENGFGQLNSEQQSQGLSKDAIFQTGIEIHEQEMSLWMSLARSNESRRFSPDIIDIVQLSQGKTLFALAATPLTSLAQFLRAKESKYLTESDALFLLASIASGAQEFHASNLAHGAISLENILVMNDPCRLCLTKIALQAGTYSKNSPAMAAHDLKASAYLAPENLLNISKKPTTQSDIYSLGIVLFRMLRGRFLYGGSSRSEIYDILSQHSVSTPNWIDEFDAPKHNNNTTNDLPIQISSETQRFLGRMLSRKPDERPRIEEVIQFCQANCMKSTGNEASQLNGLFSEPHAIFEMSRSKKSAEATPYFDEDVYFGFLLNTTIDDNQVHQNFAVPVTVKVFSPTTDDESMLQNYIAKLHEYKEIVDSLNGGQSNADKFDAVRIFEIAKLPNNKIVIMIDYSNQGTLEEYMQKRKDKTNRSTLSASSQAMLRLLPSAAEISEQLKCHDGIHPANISLYASKLRTGIPLFLNESTLQKRQAIYDYFSPETKRDPAKVSASADSWSYGMAFYRACFGDLPIFDLNKKPIFQQSYSTVINEHIRQIIESCLIVESESRPTLNDVINYIQQAGTIQLENPSNFDANRVAELMPVNERLLNYPRVTVQDLEGNDALFQYKDNVDSYRMKNMLGMQKSPALRPDQLNARTKNDRGGRFFQRRGQPRNSNVLNDDFDQLSDVTASETQGQGFFGATAGGPKGIEGNSNFPRAKDVAYDDQILMNQTMHSDTKRNNNQPTLQVIDIDSNPNDTSTAGLNNLNNKLLIGGEDNPDDDLEGYDDVNARGIIRAKQIAVEEDEFIVKNTNGTKGLQIIPAFVKGSNSLKFIKNILKLLFIATILLAVFFRKNIANSWEAMANKDSMKIVTITLLTGAASASSTTQIITSDTNQFMQTQIEYEKLKQNSGCLDNLYFLSPTNEITILEAISSSNFGFYAFMCFVSLLLITALRVFHVFRLDLLTVYQNAESGLLRPFNTYLLHTHVFSYLDFAFLYYSHYQFFHLFFYSNYSPCFGVEQTRNTIPILADSARYTLSNDTSGFVTNIFFTVGFAGILHLASIIFYLLHPLKYASFFAHPIHIVARVILYIGYAWIICRIGMSLTFQPTYGFDELRVIPNLLGAGEYQAVFGYIPEILEIILILIDVIVECICHYCGVFSERRQLAAAGAGGANSGNGSANANSAYGQVNAYNSALKGNNSPTKRKREQQQSIAELQRNNPVIIKSAVKNYSGGMSVNPSRISGSKYPPSVSSYQQNPRAPSIQ